MISPASTNGCHFHAVQGAAVVFSHDGVLCDVDKAPGQVTRVRCLERRIRETFARTVSTDEVLQYAQDLLGSSP